MYLIEEVGQDPGALAAIEKLYERSFPAAERLPFDLLIDKILVGKATFLTAWEEGELVGMVYYAVNECSVYIFYFAIAPGCQGQGHGSEILGQLLCQFKGHKIFLLVERLDEDAENNAERIRRKDFYLRNGFASDDIFLVTRELPFELLYAAPKPATVEDYLTIKEYYYAP